MHIIFTASIHKNSSEEGELRLKTLTKTTSERFATKTLNAARILVKFENENRLSRSFFILDDDDFEAKVVSFQAKGLSVKRITLELMLLHCRKMKMYSLFFHAR